MNQSTTQCPGDEDSTNQGELLVCFIIILTPKETPTGSSMGKGSGLSDNVNHQHSIAD